MCIDDIYVFTHAQNKLAYQMSPHLVNAFYQDQSCRIPAFCANPWTSTYWRTRKHASHEALFKGSFCTVMAQMFTPLAFHVTPIQPTKFHTWQWQKELEVSKNKSKNVLQLRNSWCKMFIYKYHIYIDTCSIQVLLHIFTHKAVKNKHVISPNKRCNKLEITAPGKTGSIWQYNSPKLLPCPSSNKVCQNGPSPHCQVTSSLVSIHFIYLLALPKGIKYGAGTSRNMLIMFWKKLQYLGEHEKIMQAEKKAMKRGNSSIQHIHQKIGGQQSFTLAVGDGIV